MQQTHLASATAPMSVAERLSGQSQARREAGYGRHRSAGQGHGSEGCGGGAEQTFTTCSHRADCSEEITHPPTPRSGVFLRHVARRGGVLHMPKVLQGAAS